MEPFFPGHELAGQEGMVQIFAQVCSGQGKGVGQGQVFDQETGCTGFL